MVMDSEKKTESCLSSRCLSASVAALEIIISLTCAAYTTCGIFHYPNYDAEILIHDELYVEARRHFPGNPAIPLNLLYWDLALFTIEFTLALYLLHGVANAKISRIKFWMTAMVTYNIILTGVFLGFIIGGISSRRLNLTGFFHAFFRFFEIAIVYSFYEELREREKQERIQRENNNTTTPVYGVV